jgi:hypothetical protein
MGTKEKLIERFKRSPKDFTWEELVRLFQLLGFTLVSRGKTSGSRMKFQNGNDVFYIHKPHPSNIVKKRALNNALNFLISKGYII